MCWGKVLEGLEEVGLIDRDVGVVSDEVGFNEDWGKRDRVVIL